MHDIDVTTLEGEFPQDPRIASESPVDEADALQLAADLLEVSSEAELDHFLGDLVRKAASSVKSFVASPVGQSVIGGLKGLAKQALPAAGRALGNAIAPGVGGAIGQKLGAAAGSALEIGHDPQLDLAKRFVHMASAAIHRAENAPSGGSPSSIASKAIRDSVKELMPELMGSKPPRPGNAFMVPVTSRAPAKQRSGGSEDTAARLANELLSVTSDEELDHFLGDLVNKAVSGIKSFASSPIGKTLVGGLKTIAKTALPVAAGALGNLIVPGVGGVVGSGLASAVTRNLEAEQEDSFLGSILGLEAEGEDNFLGALLGEADAAPKPIEKAKDVVKVAAAAAKKAAAAPAGADIRKTVKKALADAMKQYAPDLLAASAAAPAAAPARAPEAARKSAAEPAKGQWFRRGNTIVIVGI